MSSVANIYNNGYSKTNSWRSFPAKHNKSYFFTSFRCRLNSWTLLFAKDTFYLFHPDVCEFYRWNNIRTNLSKWTNRGISILIFSCKSCVVPSSWKCSGRRIDLHAWIAPPYFQRRSELYISAKACMIWGIMVGHACRKGRRLICMQGIKGREASG